MRIFEELRGIAFAIGVEIPTDAIDLATSVSVSDSSDNMMWYIDTRLHKFQNDEVMNVQDNNLFFLDGYIENKDEICNKHNTNSWNQAFSCEIDGGGPNMLRGGFCGFVYNGEKYRLFVDQVGNRPLYYYAKGNVFILSTRLFFITEILKASNIKCSIDEQAVKYLLSLGFMPDDTTICEDIKRVCPGTYVDLFMDGRREEKQYYILNNTCIETNMTFGDAIDGLDFYFREAIRREFEKDKEYGYRYLVDLSGGLDSRMTSWVAHDMGYEDQINIAYCQKEYLDFDIAQRIACDLRHKFIYMPLDDFKWFEDIEINTRMLNCAVPYVGATGAHHILDIIKGSNCGIEHTGMVGDSIIGTFYNKREYNYSKPVGNENAFSTFLKYDVPKEILDKYENREQFSIYTRGLLGAQSSYMLRQNYFETASAFLDADFLSFILSVPFKYRVGHKLYLAWLDAKYPDSTRYGWEKWHGVRPTEKAKRIEKKYYQMKYVFNKTISKALYGSVRAGMTPIDYWYEEYEDTRLIVEKYFNDSVDVIKTYLSKELLSDMKKMFWEGNVGEKEQVVTTCAAIMQLL